MLPDMDDLRSSYPGGARRLRSFDYADPDATYFVTICTQDREPIFCDAQYAQVVIDCLQWLRVNRGVAIYAQCLMPDHLHLFIRTGRQLGGSIRALKTYTTRQLQALGRPGKLWQDDYHDHIMRRHEDAAGVARYILQNPVRAGLVEAADEYPWSDRPDPM